MNATSGQRAIRNLTLSTQIQDLSVRYAPHIPQAPVALPRLESRGDGLSPRQHPRSCWQQSRRRLPGSGPAGCAGLGQPAVGSSGGFGSVPVPGGGGCVRFGRCSRRCASPGRVPSEVGSGRSCVRAVGGHAPLQVSLRETCVVATPRSDAPEGCTVSRPPRCWLLLVDRARSCV